ncbi:UNVERIFIED_CONTAM: MBL fold metallo-hydrolase [Halobacillus marinus]|uniref:MBL fold metallo-hydrolase n=1 Tax=Bacillus sp. SB49 TaxID=1071080 RepID=UPI000417B82B|nr:MBL fold metallo-hydrolase [Bacillus sp. SB49]QHT47891.1 MBL fold metallo-hydrolase [Bacillus sp. SB49]
MNIQLIRNATLLVTYAGKKVLIDPMLAEKGAYPPFPDSPRQEEQNPLVDLPLPVEMILQDVDAVLLTHLHLDHFDDAAKDALPKDMKLFVQNDADAETVKESGFRHVEVLTAHTEWQGIGLAKTKGEHGRGDILTLTGEVCGVVFRHPSEETLYVAGDTVWYEGVQEEIDRHAPGIIVVNGGDNQFNQGGSLVMSKEDILEVHRAAPHATILSVHMEAVNHWMLSREELAHFAEERGFHSHLLVPKDGEKYDF